MWQKMEIKIVTLAQHALTSKFSLSRKKMDFNKWIEKLPCNGVKVLKGAADISYFSFPYT